MGYIYIMTNPSFPEYVKIGYAEDAKKRLKNGNDSSWTPFAFRLYATYQVSKNKSDTLIHNIISRTNSDLRAVDNIEGRERKREFFKMSAEDAYSVLKSIAEVSDTEDRLWKNNKWTKEEKDDDLSITKIENENEHTRKSNFKFEDVNVEPESIICFKYDQNIKAKVVGNNQVEYMGKRYAISSLALKLINQMPGYHWNSAHGAAYFTYNGVLLSHLWKGKTDIYNGSKGKPKNNALYEKYGLKDGDKIKFIRKEDIDLVIKDNRVIYKNKPYSLSKLAKILLKEYCNLEWKSVQGPAFFTFKGTLLKDLENK